MKLNAHEFLAERSLECNHRPQKQRSNLQDSKIKSEQVTREDNPSSCESEIGLRVMMKEAGQWHKLSLKIQER
jgi:hypothetical protein